MKTKHSSLKPVALVLPGLLALSSPGAWDTYEEPGGAPGWYAQAEPNVFGSGFTEAKYDRDGFSLEVNRHSYGIIRISGAEEVIINDSMTGSFVIVTTYWSENTYSYGLADVWNYYPFGEYAYAEVRSDL